MVERVLKTVGLILLAVGLVGLGAVVAYDADWLVPLVILSVVLLGVLNGVLGIVARHLPS